MKWPSIDLLQILTWAIKLKQRARASQFNLVQLNTQSFTLRFISSFEQFWHNWIAFLLHARGNTTQHSSTQKLKCLPKKELNTKLFIDERLSMLWFWAFNLNSSRFNSATVSRLFHAMMQYINCILQCCLHCFILSALDHTQWTIFIGMIHKIYYRGINNSSDLVVQSVSLLLLLNKVMHSCAKCLRFQNHSNLLLTMLQRM